MSAFSGSLQMPGGISLRFSRPSDENFLLDMFKAARPWFDWLTLPPEQIGVLYKDQLRISRVGTETVYPEHLDFIIEKTGQDVGHLLVDLGYADWHVGVLEIHPLARSKGIGADVIRGLQAAATASKLPLTVSTADMLTGALQFYGRLGFQVLRHQPPAVHMVWTPPGVTW